MYTLENSNPLVECRVRRLTRSGVTSMPSDVDKATRSSSWSMLSSSVPPRSMGERGSGGGGGGGGGRGGGGGGGMRAHPSAPAGGPPRRDSVARDRARPAGGS